MAKVRDVMTADPVTITRDASLAEASRLMRDRDIGALVVLAEDDVAGVITDRDIVVRGIAENRMPDQTPVSEVTSEDVVTVSPEDELSRVVETMRERALRRVPVVESGHPVGIVSLGDLAVDRDPDSVLGQISAADPNR
ncbi:MAG TPA: CBS domain-containing protein [Actinomycetota bacterium]|jgi:CBS domain-containing protein|nr:CBS domain-containing protein [Actinomycetota bacterium]